MSIELDVGYLCDLSGYSPRCAKPRQLDHFDGHVLEGLLASGSFNSTLVGLSQTAAGTLIGIYENLAGATDTAHRAFNPPAAPHTTQTLATSAYLHGLNVGLLRSLMPNTFGAMHLINRQEADPHRFYLSDLPSEEQRLRRVMSEYMTAEGRPMKARSPAPHLYIDPLRDANHKLLGMPRNHPTVRQLSALNQRINAAHFAEVEARGVGEARVNGALQQGLDEHAAQANSRVHRVLGSLPFAAGVLMLEIWNVRMELGAAEQVRREKEELRVGLSYIAASTDLVIAMEMLTVKLAGTESVLAVGRQIIFTISEETAEKLFHSYAGLFVRKFSARLFAQIASGFLLSAISLYDSLYAQTWGDDAKWGYLMMSLGGSISGISGFIVSTTTFLGLGPAGWAALILTMFGAGLAWWLSDKPIEEWLVNGPFGTQVHSGNAHLLEPQRSFYYLISLFADIRIHIGRNPEFVPNAKLDVHATTPFQVVSANTSIRIESNLPGLIGHLGTLSINAQCQLNTFEIAGGRLKSETVSFSKLVRSQLVEPQAQRLIPQGLELFVETPRSFNFDAVRGETGITHQWQVRAQCVLEHANQRWHFPTPPPKDGTPFDETHSQPDFSREGALYWVDEVTNKSKDSI